MTPAFVPKLDVLPAPQRRLWPELAALPRSFALYGGTAIALHLGHRHSIDFDFFSDQALTPALLDLPLLSGMMVTQRAPDTLSGIVDRGGPIKLSFFGVPKLPRLRPPLAAPDNGLPVASLLDLAGTKAAVVQVRAEAKDYADLDAILLDGRVDLPMALASAARLYGAQFNPQITLKALTYYDDPDVARLPAAVQRRLTDAVRKVDLDRLPRIE